MNTSQQIAGKGCAGTGAPLSSNVMTEENDKDMNNEYDWRLTNQEKYLKGVTLYHREYSRYCENWDHDHCEFCLEKFSEQQYPSGSLHEGYTTEDNYRWICEKCFNDFREDCEWELG